ncbi:lipopolysaccharide biosynthesis protein [Lactiplantibacillus plantarum]|uniref:lipopolysaccharide biosynthesis protein n=1 Tax=Lactiplantibacillus plantarum TaxID=1590 RepID=UPI0032E4B390
MQRGIASGVSWKLFERFGVQGVSFILQVVLARLLSPSDYGMLSLMAIFVSLTNILIQNGFNSALMQKKDTDELDFSSVFWVCMISSSIMYIILFALAPVISHFFGMPGLVWPFRVLTLMLLPGAWNSVQLAVVGRNLDFKKVFTSNVLAVVISGLIGICAAFLGAGVWALVVQTLLNSVIACIVMALTVDWFPKMEFDFSRVSKLFSFGWKLLFANLLDELYQDSSSLIVGKLYNAGQLGIYNRGRQFPQLINNSVTGAVQSVMLPAMAKLQDNHKQMLKNIRQSIQMIAFLTFPIMSGLAAIASNLVLVLLTAKWINCVPYLRLFCVAMACYPIYTCNFQAFNAVGRSDVYLKVEIQKKVFGVLTLIAAVLFSRSILILTWTIVLTNLLGIFLNIRPNFIMFGYRFSEQARDIVPSAFISVIMGILVYYIGGLISSPVLGLVIQLATGLISYVVLARLLKMKQLSYLINMSRK